MTRLALILLTAGMTLFSPQGPDATPVDKATANDVLTRTAATFPKFDRALADVTAHDKLIHQVVFVRQPGAGRGPAFASSNGLIQIDLSYLETPKPNFDDNRMVVVLYHELGHLHYFETVPRDQWTPDHSEQAAFEYSLKMTNEMAEHGDCGPLATGVKFMKLRSESDNLADPHVRALKRMVSEPLYAGHVAYVAAHCPAK